MSANVTEKFLFLMAIKDAVMADQRLKDSDPEQQICAIVNQKLLSMRLYRVHRLTPLALFVKEDFNRSTAEQMVPVTGTYVAVSADESTGKVQLGFAVANDTNARGRVVDALEYGPHESQKAYDHILDYLVNGTIPVADGE